MARLFVRFIRRPAGLALLVLFALPAVILAQTTDPAGPLPVVSPSDMLTVAGASVVVSVLVGILLNAWRPTPEIRDRFGPLICFAIAEAVTIGFGAVQGADLTNAFIVGILVTGGADFTHSVAQAATSTT